LEKRDTLFPVADMQELIQVNLPSYYKGRACLLLARYYDVISPQLDSTWEYLHKAKSHFESTGTITRDYVDCLQYLSEHSTYHRKNLLAIRYANIPCEFEKYWPEADYVDKSRAYANRAFMLFREDDYAGTLQDVEKGLKLVNSSQNPEIYQSLLKSKLVVYMIRAEDSLWQNTFLKIKENVELTGRDY